MAYSTNQAMSNPTRWQQNAPSARATSLTQWIDHHGQQLNLLVQGRVRGHSLHLLCESTDPSDDHPPSQRVVRHYFQAHVDGAELNHLVGSDTSSIRHLWLYGRVKGARQPAWTESIPLIPIQHRHAQPYQGVARHDDTPQADGTATDSPMPGTQATDWYTLAEQGHPNAIAHYLHHILADLGINAKIRVKVQRHRPNTTKDRLWIICRGSYCPAAALVGKPIARQLRALSLANIEDALLQFQVSGEDQPDWVLRIDLTPQEEILKEWARWGDVEAISRLVNQRLQPCHSQLIEATLKDTTLHLSCAVPEPAIADNPSVSQTPVSQTPASQTPTTAPSSSMDGVNPQVQGTADSVTDPSILAAIKQLLTDLVPQGIHNTVLYGQRESATPAWVEWIDLPAKHQLDRAVSPLELANNGDGDAIAFLLRRLLNPDLNTQLATGGIRIQVLTKKHIIHVMCDAPLCPAKDEVVPKVERLLQSLELPGIRGIRLYGRRAGQRKPRWHYGIDLGPSTAMVPDPTPQFAATDAYVTELVAPTTEPIVRPDITPSELWSRWQAWRQRITQMVRRSLLSTHLVVPTSDSPELMLRSTPRYATVKTAIIWAAVGVLALVQTDLGLKQLARWSLEGTAIGPAESNQPDRIVSPPAISLPPDSVSEISATFPISPSGGEANPNNADQPSPYTSLAEDIPSEFHHSADDTIFDGSEFIAPAGQTPGAEEPHLQPDRSQPNRPPAKHFDINSPQSVTAAQLSTTLANSPYPSFNSDQLDYKLALYYQRLLEVGPPDVLVVGSSRALRGVDPVILEQALADLGYANADVFNFGVNGATAQVVELILQEILLPEQLPKLIIWADGARAFNSGRDDRTYNGILASEGYERLLDGSLVRPSAVAIARANDYAAADPPEDINELARSLSKSYQALDEQLSDGLAGISAAYGERDRLKAILQQGLTALLPPPPASSRDIGQEMAIAPSLDNQDSPINADLDNSIDAENPDNPARVQPQMESPTSLSALDNIDVDGFLPLSVRFDPAQYYQQYARVPGNYDRDYSNFRLDGRQGDALQTLVSLGQTYDIPIVFINMPLTQEYLDPFRVAYEQTFRQYMLNLALQQEHFVFRDLGPLWLDDTDHRSYFSDPSHLNRYGAYEVSQHISKDPMIPWDATTQ
ncbi:MAG: hypothetical protein F6K30_24645 [Cyanothece sp. SIO2G6]|nr:hypothetical protein [Cyanothece sp. SIO2G6]